MNIKPLNSSAITPELLIQHVAEQAKNLKEIHVVGILEDGESILWTSGHLEGLVYAAFLLQDLASKHLNREMGEDN